MWFSFAERKQRPHGRRGHIKCLPVGGSRWLPLCGRYLSEYIRQEGIYAGKSKDILGRGM